MLVCSSREHSRTCPATETSSSESRRSIKPSGFFLWECQVHGTLLFPPLPATRGQISEIGEGGEHKETVVICMPERLGFCTYTEGPEQSLSGEKEGIKGVVL